MMQKTMLAAVLHAPGDLRIQTVDMPVIKDDEVLVHVQAAGICGSDLERVMVTGTYRFPTIPGHEFCGVVKAVGGKVTAAQVGDRVAIAPLMPCFTCEFCLKGNYGQCNNYDFLGSRRDGGFAQYVAVPQQNLLHLPDSVDFASGAALEPAAVTLHGLRRARVNPGDRVAVLGCGAIGLFALQFARLMGATCIIAVDIAPDKLELAKQLGANHVLDASKTDVVNAIQDITQGGAELSIETAGTAVTQEQCLRTARKQGRILYLGTAHKDVVFPPQSFECIIRNELVLYGAWNSYGPPYPGPDWRTSLEMLADGRLNASRLISHTFPLTQAPQVFNELMQCAFPYTKVLFTI